MSWFSKLITRRHSSTELEEEIRVHLEEKADELMAAGMSPSDAMAAARRAFGNVTQIREASREVWRSPGVESFLMDVRFALRLLRRHPAFSANVILISALGIGACAATFSLVSGILLSPLPFPHPERVFTVELRAPDGRTSSAVSAAGYLRMADRSPVIESVAHAIPDGAIVDWSGEPERLSGRRVTPSFFGVFGVVPLIGRPFTTDEAVQRERVVLLGHALWRARFNGDSGVVGRALVLDDVSHTIVGVMPAAFRAHYVLEPDLWLPLDVSMTGASDGSGSVNPIVRLAEGVTRARAETWLATVLGERMVSARSRDSVAATPGLVPIRERIHGDVSRPLQVLLGSVMLVLLLVAANVATMFLARSAARERELGVRRALGASLARQVRQLVTESVTLTALGGLAGVALSYWIIGAIRGLGVRVLPRMDAVTLDWRVATFAVVATILTGVVGGLAPALTARRDARVAAGGARVTGLRLSSALVMVQITLSVVLLVGAGLLAKSFLRVVPTEPGFAIEHRATLTVSLRDLPDYPPDDARAARRFVRDVREALRQVATVRDVAAMSFLPFVGSASYVEIKLSGRPAAERTLMAFENRVTANFFDVMRIPIQRGRAFTEADREGAEPVAIVNETAAARWWPGEDPIGRQVTVQGSEHAAVTVVGVSRDGRLFGPDTRIRPQIFLPAEQANPRFVSFIVHTSGDPRGIARDLRRAVWRVEPRLPVGSAGDVATVALESVRRPRFFAWAMGAFALAAVSLSALAVYGLLTLDVVQRRNEIGIRLAMGATGSRIGALVAGRALMLGLRGALLGLILAGVLSRFLESLLLEVQATDAAVFVAMTLAALAAAALAAGAPAYRASRVDPARTLRT